MKQFILLTIFLLCSFLLTAQIRVHSNGSVQIGNSPQPMYSPNTTLQVDANTIVFNTPFTSFGPQFHGGFIFRPSAESTPIGGGGF